MKTNRPRLTVLSLAIAAALAAMVPTMATADTVISTDETATRHWNDSDFTIKSGASLSASPNSAAVYTDGNTLGTLSNNGTISSLSGGIVSTDGQIGMLNNSGTIHAGSYYAIGNLFTHIQTLDNSGMISGDFGGIYNKGVIDTLNNSGTIKSSNGYGINNDVSASIGSFDNSGSIDKLLNSGSIDSFFNHGGTITALNNQVTGTISDLLNFGSIDMLDNSGTLTGRVGVNNGGSVGAGTTLVGGSGTIGTLNNSGTIIATGGSGIVNQDGIIGTLTNSGSIVSSNTFGIYNNTGSEITTLTNTTSGTIEGLLAGVFNAGLITTLDNRGHIEGTGVAQRGISNGGMTGSGMTATMTSGTIGTLSNSGTIHGAGTGLFNAAGSKIGTLTNGGTISSDIVAISNEGLIDHVTNTGLLTGINGIVNTGTITSMTNSGDISGTSEDPMIFSFGIGNAGSIASLDNRAGSISGTIGVLNAGHIDMLGNNGGVINGDIAAIFNGGSIDTLSNESVIQTQGVAPSGAAFRAAIFNAGTIGTLVNNSIIESTDGYAIHNGFLPTMSGLGTYGTIGTLNNSGVITGGVGAIYIEANSRFDLLVNSGVIAGSIVNESARELTVKGGSETDFGVLTGINGGTAVADIGRIVNTTSNVVFSGGNQLLNDHIDVGGNAVINSAGTLQIVNQIKITGNYGQSAAAQLNIRAQSGAVANGDAADTGYGRLIVSGSAVIDAGSSVMLSKRGAYGFANGQRYLVIQANNTGTDYNEGTLRYGATGFNGSVTGNSVADGSNLDLILTLDGGTVNQATNNNAQSALDGLFKYAGTDAGLMNLFNAAAAIGSSDAGNRAGSQLNSASGIAGVSGSSTAVSQQVGNIAFNRLDSTSSASAQGGSGLSGGDGMSDKAAWGQAFGGRASDDGRDGVSGYHASYTGLLVGVDTPLNDRWRAGGLFSYAATSVSNDGNNAGSYANVDSYGLTAYAGYTGESWYVNMAVGAMRGDIDAHRVIDFIGFNGVANSSYNSMQYTAAVQAGYPINFDHVLPGAMLTPLAGLTYSSLRLDGYTETGGNGAALHVDAADTHSVKSDLGFKLERTYKNAYGLLKPTAQLLWRHEYSDTRLQSVANFAADTSGATTFVTEGAKPVADTGVLSFGATLLRNENLTLSVNYTLEQGGGYTSQTGSLLARWQF